MTVERSVLEQKVQQILSQKKFTEEAKNKLLQSILFVYDHYNPPKYIKRTRKEYIDEYLRVLENMNGYAVIKLEELNLDYYEPIKEFRADIEKVTDGRGNLEYVNGEYIPSKNGSYACLTKGFACLGDRIMYTLGEGNLYDELITVHHEMTHLSEGERPFNLGSQVPLSFELRKMFAEGRAVSREANVAVSTKYYQIERISDQTASFKIQSEKSYPLYNKLYQTLQIIFGVDVLEEFALNDNRECDMFEELKKRFPDLPVNDIFAHLIYIISSKENMDKKVLLDAIKSMKSFRDLLLSRKVLEIDRKEENIKNLEQSILDRQHEIERITILLKNPEQLERDFQKECETIKKEIEEWYKAKEITEEEYQRQLKEFEIEATIEVYQDVKNKELQQSIEDKKSEEVSLSHHQETLSKLRQEYQILLEDNFGEALEQVCIQNPSLEISFSFLENIAFQKIRGEYAKLSEEDRMNEEGKIYLAQLQKLFDLKEHTIIVDEKQKTSFVS